MIFLALKIRSRTEKVYPKDDDVDVQDKRQYPTNDSVFFNRMYKQISNISISKLGPEVFGKGQLTVGDWTNKQNKTILLINLVSALNYDKILYTNIGSTFKNICEENPNLLYYICGSTLFDNKTTFFKHLQQPDKSRNIFNNICVVCCGDGARSRATIKLYPERPKENSNCMLLFDSDPDSEKSFEKLSILRDMPDKNSYMKIKFSTRELQIILAEHQTQKGF